MKPVKISKSALKKSTSFDKSGFFTNPEKVAEAIAEALLEGDKEAFFDIIKLHLKYVNKEELSRKSKVPIATIRRIAAGSNFNIHTLFKITEAISKAS